MEYGNTLKPMAVKHPKFTGLAPKPLISAAYDYKKAQLSLTNPRDACEKFARFT